MKKNFRFSNLTLRIWGVAALALGLTANASATTVRKMELPDLVRQSESIVQGRVEQVYVQWDPARKLAFTYISVRVDEPMKGPRRRAVLIRQVGGKVGALNVHVAGMPNFQTGDQVVVFLKDQQDGTFQVMGLSQGKYEIVNDFAVSNVSGLDLIDPKTGRIVDAGFVERVPLTEFKAKIRELMR